MAKGAVPLVLCSTRLIHGDNVPHWIVVTGFKGEHVHVNDPWVALDRGKTAHDMTDIPLTRREMLCRSGMGFATLGLTNLLASEGLLHATPQLSPLGRTRPCRAGRKSAGGTFVASISPRRRCMILR